MAQSPLEARVLKLEAQIRRQRLAFGSITVLLPLAFLVMAQAAPATKRIVADEFVIADENGTEFAKLSRSGLEINGYFIHKTKLDINSWGINFNYASKNIAYFGAAGGNSMINLGDKIGNGISIGVIEDADSFISVHSRKDPGGPEIRLVMQGEQPALQIRDNLFKDRAVLGCTSLEAVKTGSVENRPPSSLVLFDREGKVIFQAP